MFFAIAGACNVWLSEEEKDAIANRLTGQDSSYDQEVKLVDFCCAVNTLTVNTAENSSRLCLDPRSSLAVVLTVPLLQTERDMMEMYLEQDVEKVGHQVNNLKVQTAFVPHHGAYPALIEASLDRLPTPKIDEAAHVPSHGESVNSKYKDQLVESIGR